MSQSVQLKGIKYVFEINIYMGNLFKILEISSVFYHKVLSTPTCRQRLKKKMGPGNSVPSKSSK